MQIKCKICGAENGEIGADSRCYNCDNDLPIRHSSQPGQKERNTGSVYAFFIGTYVFIFMIGAIGYLLETLDNAPEVHTDAFSLFLAMIAAIHLMIVKRIENIEGLYKGQKRYNFSRFVILYGLVGLIIYHMVNNGLGDKNKVFYLMMMIPSLILSYTYYFGKRCGSFFYPSERHGRRARRGRA